MLNLLTAHRKMLLLQFLVGSSIIPTAIPLVRIAASGNVNRVIDNYAGKSLFIPFLFGVASVLAYVVMKMVKREVTYLLVGGVLGLFLSALGKFNYDAPTKLFGYEPENEWMHYVANFAMYGLIFYVVVRPLTAML